MATNNTSKGYTKNLSNFNLNDLKTPLERLSDLIDEKIEQLESIRTLDDEDEDTEDIEDEQEMSEADKIEERGIAQFEDDRQSNW